MEGNGGEGSLSLHGDSAPSGYRFPAEWEPHESVWMSWPQKPERIEGWDCSRPMLKMIVALMPHVKVSLCVNDEKQKREVVELLVLKEGQEQVFLEQRIVWRFIKHDEHWMRDFGPIFLKSDKKEDPLIVANFDWNCWGYIGHIIGYDKLVEQGLEAEVIGDGKVGLLASQRMRIKSFNTNFVSEGGDREYNGKGTLMVCEAVELQRNPHMTKEELTERLKQVFNIKKVIWLKRGLADDYQVFEAKFAKHGVFNLMCTGGHVDEFARFVDDRTILLTDILEEERSDPIGKASYENMEENYQILLRETDQDGQPFTIIRMPLPPTIYTEITPTSDNYEMMKVLRFDDETVVLDGKTSLKGVVPASYCNFLVTNGLVLLPYYHTEGRSEHYKKTDDLSKEILQRAYPDRKIVQIDAVNINIGGGGMHCITQQEPLRDV